MAQKPGMWIAKTYRQEDRSKNYRKNRNEIAAGVQRAKAHISKRQKDRQTDYKPIEVNGDDCASLQKLWRLYLQCRLPQPFCTIHTQFWNQSRFKCKRA